ncbi:MAG: M20/M25/M40 family metallo-hydrolase [Candidatus Sumerlaeota bacterium]|nr:M20/M25/M40 family metallo-hydrolase [Candidatus Sumerlaeota bacterium]
MSVNDEQWALNLLREIVRRYSPSRQEKEVAEFLARAAREAGWDARVDETGNFIAQRGTGASSGSGAPLGSNARSESGARHLLFIGHIDTVTGEIPMREEGEGKDRILYGRGAVDAKGPLAAFLAAATRANIPDGFRITCVGAVEEETSTSRGARAIIAQPQYKPDYLIIGEPSGWDTLCLGYKGNCHLRLTLAQDRSHGASASSSAGTLACRFWSDVLKAAEARRQGDKITQQVTVDVNSINTESDGLIERAAIRLDIRTPYGYDNAAFLAELERLHPAGASLEILENLPPVRGSKQGELPRAFLKAIRAEQGEARFSFKTGTSDMNIAGPAWNCPMLAYGPGDSTLDHTPNEHIALDEYLRSIRVLTKALEDVARSKQP